MKIIISKKSLETAVKNICRVINKNNALPILDDIKCDVATADKELTLTGGDGEIWLHYKVALDAAEGENGSFCVGAKWFKLALAELKEQPITITLNKYGTSIAIEHMTGSTHLPASDGESYPSVRWTDGPTRCWSLDGTMLKRVLTRSLFFISDDELRPAMTGVFFSQTEEQLNIAASDGHVLIHNAETISNELGEFIMPCKAAKLLPKLMAKPTGVRITFDDRMVSVAHEQMKLEFIAIDSRYPNFLSVIPPQQTYELTADVINMLSALRNVINFTNTKNHTIKMDIRGDHRLTVYGIDFDNAVAADDYVDIEYPKGTPMQIGANGKSVINILKMIDGRQVTIRFTEPSRAITFTPAEPIYENEHVTMLAIPVLLAD